MIPLTQRLKNFSLRIIKLYSSLPKSQVAEILGKQFLRSGTSVGAHYHEAVFSRSNDETIAKIDLALQELSETGYWIDLLVDAEIISKERLELLQNELHELKLILVSISRKIKAKKKILKAQKIKQLAS